MDTEESIFDLPIERLNLIDHEVYKWICMVEGCTCGTHVRDYGESPFYYHPRKSIKWFDATNEEWLCSVHWPLWKKGIVFPSKEKTCCIDNLVFVRSIVTTDIKLRD